MFNLSEVKKKFHKVIKESQNIDCRSMLGNWNKQNFIPKQSTDLLFNKFVNKARKIIEINIESDWGEENTGYYNSKDNIIYLLQRKNITAMFFTLLHEMAHYFACYYNPEDYAWRSSPKKECEAELIAALIFEHLNLEEFETIHYYAIWYYYHAKENVEVNFQEVKIITDKLLKLFGKEEK